MSLRNPKEDLRRLPVYPEADCSHVCTIPTVDGLRCLWCGELVWAPPEVEGTDNTLSGSLDAAGFGSYGIM